MRKLEVTVRFTVEVPDDVVCSKVFVDADGPFTIWEQNENDYDRILANCPEEYETIDVVDRGKA